MLGSENGQLILVTYNSSNKVISKHQINLQLNAEDFTEFRNPESSKQDTGSVVMEMEIDSCQSAVGGNEPGIFGLNDFFFLINFK